MQNTRTYQKTAAFVYLAREHGPAAVWRQEGGEVLVQKKEPNLSNWGTSTVTR